MRSFFITTLQAIAEARYRSAFTPVLSLDQDISRPNLYGVRHNAEEALYRPAGGFTPSQLTGLSLWLRADLGVTVTNVAQWNDSSGSGDPNRNFVQGTVAQQPTLNPSNTILNHQPSVDFSHPDAQVMNQVGEWSIDPSQPYWMVIVAYDIDFTRQQGWVGDINENGWYLSSYYDPAVGTPPNFFGSSITASAINLIETDVTDTGAPVIYMAEFNDPNGSTIRINSNIPATTKASPPQTPPARDAGALAALPQLQLGATFGSAASLDGSVGFLVVGHGIMSDEDRESLLTWLSNKFDIPVAGPIGSPIAYPTQIPNVDLILDPSRGITGGVSEWRDQSLSADPNRNVIQATASHRPTSGPAVSGIGSQPAIRFVGASQQELDMVGLWSGGAIPQPYTSFVVGTDAASGNEVFLGQFSGASNWYIVAITGHYGASVGATLVGTTADSVTPKVLNIDYNDPTSEIRVSELTREAVGNIAAGSLPILALGAANSGTFLSGDIAEVIIYDRLLSATERSQLMSYLGTRYGILIGP